MFLIVKDSENVYNQFEMFIIQQHELKLHHFSFKQNGKKLFELDLFYLHTTGFTCNTKL